MKNYMMAAILLLGLTVAANADTITVETLVQGGLRTTTAADVNNWSVTYLGGAQAKARQHNEEYDWFSVLDKNLGYTYSVKPVTTAPDDWLKSGINDWITPSNPRNLGGQFGSIGTGGDKGYTYKNGYYAYTTVINDIACLQSARDSISDGTYAGNGVFSLYIEYASDDHMHAILINGEPFYLETWLDPENKEYDGPGLIKSWEGGYTAIQLLNDDGSLASYWYTDRENTIQFIVHNNDSQGAMQNGVREKYRLNNNPTGFAVNVSAAYVIFSKYDDDNPPTVPEPGSILLLGTGIMGLGFAAKRKLRKK
jgi:hypothetical protein